jgi:hypothetical protein
MNRLRAAVACALVAAVGVACVSSPDPPGREVEDEALVQTARDVVALIGGYNCELLPRYLPAGAAELFASNIGPELMDGMHDPVERVCFVLGVIDDYPASETMDVRATVLTDARADLILVGDGRRADLHLVRDSGGWVIDPRWALGRVQDLAVLQALREFAITQDEFYSYGDKRFTASAAELTAATHSVVSFIPGVASVTSRPMWVFASLGPNAQSVCGSSRSLSGEVFMIRQAANGTTSYARGPSVPAACPGDRLAASW